MAAAATARAYGDPYYQRASAVLLAAEPNRLANDNDRRPPLPGWNALYTHYEARLQSLYTWRLTWWHHWAEIARYMLWRRYHAFVTPNTNDRGVRRDAAIVDETATFAGQICSNGLMAGLTDPDRPWLRLGPAIPGVELDRAGQMFYDDLTERLRYIQAESNFYDSLAVAYEDLTFFGNGVVVDYEDAQQVFRAQNYCAGEYYLAAGYDYGDEALYVDERKTVAQIVEMFGLQNCPEEVRNCWAQKGAALETEFVVGHAIEPNFAVDGGSGRGVGQVPGGFPWRESFWLRGKPTERPLSISGFNERPFSVMRWNTVSNNAYAWGPATDVLGSTIQLQLESRQKAEALEKIVRPPMLADVGMKNQPASIRPGNTTYVDSSNNKKGYWPAFEVRPDIAAISADIALVQDRIRTGFYNNLFRMIEELSERAGNKTATEVDALKEERLMQLGPVIGRVYNEGLRPRIWRQLAIMKRRGLWPAVPNSLRNMPMKAEFISMLTLAQRASSTISISQAFAFAQSIAPQYPQAKNVLDPDEAIREFSDLRGVPSRVVRSPQSVKQMNAAEAHAAQTAAMAQTAMAGVQGAAALGKASIAPGSALGALVGGGAATGPA